ncbi:MAG TPA: cytochrome b [Burkholderiales bacterium]|nr:cytochrome b [Burkholderiales bacterium]
MDEAPARRAPVEIYSRTARFFHWLIVALIAVQVPIGLSMVYRGNVLNVWDAVTGVLYNSHKLIGVTILLAVLCRLGYRLVHGAPADEPTIEPWQRIASSLNHWGMYVLLICVPVAGYIGISLFPALDIFGPIALPAVVAADKEAAKTAFAVHKLLVALLILLIAAHVAAALFHHFVRRDNVLGRMIPKLLRR